jgi:hypothetical protein
MHSARVLGLRPAEELGRRAVAPWFQVGHLQGMQMEILGVGDLRLSAKVKAPHRDTIARIRVGRDHQPPGLIDLTVGTQHVCRSSYGGAAEVELVGRDVQVEQQMLDFTNRLFLWEHGQNMKAQGRCELEARKHDNLGEQPLHFGEVIFFLRQQAARGLQLLEKANLLLQPAVSRDRVVVSQGDGGKAAGFGPPEHIHQRNSLLLIIRRGRSVKMQIDREPLSGSALDLLAHFSLMVWQRKGWQQPPAESR